MKSNNYEIYLKQLNEAVIRYPNLSVIERNDKRILKGILDIPNDNMDIVGSYLIEIHFTAKFPYRFPKLFEIGGAICNDIDWHKYSDGSCCITVLPDEILKCKSGISILDFIEKYCLSFFANHIHRKLKGVYLNGEYSHGPKGFAEFYGSLLNTNDASIWLKYFDHVFRKANFSTDRNIYCFCGSKIKFKKCHKLIFDSMWEIGEHQIFKDFKSIIS